MKHLFAKIGIGIILALSIWGLGFLNKPEEIKIDKPIVESMFGASSIVHDATSSGTALATPSMNLALTIAAGDDRGLWVTIMWHGSQTVSSVYWNTTEQMTEAINHEASSDRNTSIYYLANPTTGTHNVTLTMSASVTVVISATSLTGTDTSDPLGATSTGAVDNKTGLTVSTTIDTADSWLIGALNYDNGIGGASVSFDSGTQRWNVSAAGVRGTGGTRTTGATGGYNTSWSWSAFINQEGVVAVAEIHQKPATPAATDDPARQNLIWFD